MGLSRSQKIRWWPFKTFSFILWPKRGTVKAMFWFINYRSDEKREFQKHRKNIFPSIIVSNWDFIEMSFSRYDFQRSLKLRRSLYLGRERNVLWYVFDCLFNFSHLSQKPRRKKRSTTKTRGEKCDKISNLFTFNNKKARYEKEPRGAWVIHAGKRVRENMVQ